MGRGASEKLDFAPLSLHFLGLYFEFQVIDSFVSDGGGMETDPRNNPVTHPSGEIKTLLEAQPAERDFAFWTPPEPLPASRRPSRGSRGRPG